jgi:hypothetical protein
VGDDDRRVLGGEPADHLEQALRTICSRPVVGTSRISTGVSRKGLGDAYPLAVPEHDQIEETKRHRP